MTAQQIAIYGGGGFARELAWLIESCNEGADLYELVCFIDDKESAQGSTVNGIAVVSLESARDRFPGARVVGGVGSPRTRELLMLRAAAAGFDTTTIVHPRVQRSRWVELGPGTVVCAGNILTSDIIIGKHVQINMDCTIGHDVVMGDYATLAPGVHVSGCVRLGKRVYVGTGAVIVNGTQAKPIVIGDDAVVGAACVVIDDVPPNVTVVGAPARIVKVRKET